jgi:hypothetical protein
MPRKLPRLGGEAVQAALRIADLLEPVRANYDA